LIKSNSVYAAQRQERLKHYVEIKLVFFKFSVLLVLSVVAQFSSLSAQSELKQQTDFSGKWSLESKDGNKITGDKTTLIISQSGPEIKVVQESSQGGTSQQLTYYADGRGETNPSDSGGQQFHSVTSWKKKALRPLFEGADNRKSLTLKDGIFHPELNERGYIKRMGAYLKYVEFADVTGDRHEEAIVALGNLCDCSGEWFSIYIYKLQRRRPGRLLWAFHTGDRAYGGLRRVYARQSKLVVELYGHGSGPNLPPPGYNGAYCCNEDYTRRSYKWNGLRFVQEGKARLLSTRGLTRAGADSFACEGWAISRWRECLCDDCWSMILFCAAVAI
jgi:hypothetical protein